MRRILALAAPALTLALLACSSPNSFVFGDDGGSDGGARAGDAQACPTCSGSSSGGGSGRTGSSSSSSGSGSSGSSSGGSQAPGTVGPNGGSLSQLTFAVVGDTRPPNEDDISGYPTAIITKIFQDVQAQSPAIPFVVSTGDYQYSSTGSSSTAAAQLMLYTQARAAYSGVQYTALGNHECTGADDSNCPAGSGKPTANYQAFMTQLLGPLQKTLPYYVINIDATDNSWTSKFVFVAANAWDSTQQSWLQTTMGTKTTYTFVIRHEPTESSGNAPGVSPSDSIITQFPYTMLITGHSHTWDSFGYNTPKEVLVGNGGAPLTNTSKNYGFAVMSRRATDGAIVGDMYDYMTLQTVSEFHFVVTPEGTTTQ